MRKAEIITLLIVLASFAVGIYIYPQMPAKMASHWNINGDVDGYMSKFWGVFLMPIISLVLLLLFTIIPKIDPLKANVDKFRKYFDGFIILIILFLFFIYLLTIYWNFGHKFDMNRIMPPALGILFYYCGILIEKAKRNWFIGIKTPWTMSSESVWDKTHKIGGKLFKIAGIIAFFGIIFPNYSFFLILLPVIAFSIYLFAYSYFEYKKESH
jgi:uncharacterized membrane protein